MINNRKHQQLLKGKVFWVLKAHKYVWWWSGMNHLASIRTKNTVSLPVQLSYFLKNFFCLFSGEFMNHFGPWRLFGKQEIAQNVEITMAQLSLPWNKHSRTISLLPLPSSLRQQHPQDLVLAQQEWRGVWTAAFSCVTFSDCLSPSLISFHHC